MHRSKKRQPLRKKTVQGIGSAGHRERESDHYFYPPEVDIFGDPIGPPRHLAEERYREGREMPPRMMRNEWEEDWLFGPGPGPMHRQGPPSESRSPFGPGPHPEGMPYPRPEEWHEAMRQERRNPSYPRGWRPSHSERERFPESMEFRGLPWTEHAERARREAASRQHRRESIEEWPSAFDETISLDAMKRKRTPRKGSR
jgi:hypothetical protein